MGNRLADLIGPFYDTQGVSTLLGISEQAVADLRDSGDLLGMQTSDDAWVYPTFQFTGHQVNPALLPALRVLHGQPDWSIGVWFVAPDENLDELSPIEWAEARRPPSAMLTAARRTAARWKGSQPTDTRADSTQDDGPHDPTSPGDEPMTDSETDDLNLG